MRAVSSDEEDGAESDLSKGSDASSFVLHESRGCCNASCCGHACYSLLFLIYVVIFPLWGKWLVSAPMPLDFWHSDLDPFPLLPLKHFGFAQTPKATPDIELSPIPTESSSCNYTCGLELKNFRNNLMNFPVELTLQRADLGSVHAHTTYPVLLASEDFENWQLVGDRRHSYPEPFWRSDSAATGNTFSYTSQKCTTKRNQANESFTSKGTYVLGCVTWSPAGQAALQAAKELTMADIQKHCTVVGGSCGWPCGSSIPSNRLPSCDASGILDPAAVLGDAFPGQQLGQVRVDVCLDATAERCTTTSQQMSQWKCHKCSVEEEVAGSKSSSGGVGGWGVGGDDDEFQLMAPPPPPLATLPPPLSIRRLEDDLLDDEKKTVIVRYKSLPRMQVRLENARPPEGVAILNTPRAFIIATHDLQGPWLKLYEDVPSDYAPPKPVEEVAATKEEEEEKEQIFINDKTSANSMVLEQRNTLHLESESCFGRRGPLYLVACAVNSSIYDNDGLWRNNDEARFNPGQKVNGPPFNDRCLAVSGVCGLACVSGEQDAMPHCKDGRIRQEYLVGQVENEFNRVPAVLAFVSVLLCGFAVRCLMLCPGIFSPYSHATVYEPEMTESFKYIVVASPVAGKDENKGTMLRNLIGVVSAMPPDCRCRYHAVINDEGHRVEIKTCWEYFCKVVEAIPNFGYMSYEENLLEFMHLWCQDTKILSLGQIGGNVKSLEPSILERLAGQATLKRLLRESKWSTFDRARFVAPLEAACDALAEHLRNNYNSFTNGVLHMDSIGDWQPKDPNSSALRLHYTSRAKPAEDARNIMVQHVAVGGWYYQVPSRNATTEDWLSLRRNGKEMVYSLPDSDKESFNVPLRSSHGKAGGLNFVDNYMALVSRRPGNTFDDERADCPTLYAIADARHQFQPDFMLSCIPCFFTESGDLNSRVAFTQAPQHYPEYADKDDYMDYNNAQFFRLNAMIRNCCGGVSSCGTNGMWLIPNRPDDTIWTKRRKRVRDRDSKKRDELIEREQFHTSCKIEDTASSLDQVLVGRHSHFVNRKLSFGMAKAPTDFIGAQQRWVEGAVTLSLQWFSFNADAHGQSAKNAWMLWTTVLGFAGFLTALIFFVCYSGDVRNTILALHPISQMLLEYVEFGVKYLMDYAPISLFELFGGNELNQDVFAELFIQFFIWIGAFLACFLALWVLTTFCKCFRRCGCSFPNEMRWWGRLIISMDNLTYFIWFWTSFFWIGFNYYCALSKMNYHFNNMGMMAFMLAVNVINWAMIICNTFRYNVMESMDANEIAALNMDNIWRSNQLFFMTGPIQAFSLVRGIGEFVKYKFYGQDIGGWSGGDLGTISVNIVKYWTSLMLLGCVGVWTAYFTYAHQYQNAKSACIVVTLISLDVLHPCTFLWLGNINMSQEEASKMTWAQKLTTRRWWQVKIKDLILNTTFTGILKFVGPGYFLLLPFIVLFSPYFGVSGAYMLVAVGPGH